MRIYELETSIHNEINEKDFLNYLSESVLSVIDDEINKLKNNLKEITNSLFIKNEEYKSIKNEYSKNTSDYAKEKQLKKVLTKIETLNKEGSLRGSRKTSIIKILPKLSSYNFSQLSKLEEQLSIF